MLHCVFMARTLEDLHESLLEEIRSIRSNSNANNWMDIEGNALMRRIQPEMSSIKRANEERGTQSYNSILLILCVTINVNNHIWYK